MKILLSPVGLIVIAAILLILFFPRRAPDAIKKKFGRPMRAFSDEEAKPQGAEQACTDEAPPAGSSATSGDPPADPPQAGKGT